jgi:hypothetical protein
MLRWLNFRSSGFWTVSVLLFASGLGLSLSLSADDGQPAPAAKTEYFSPEGLPKAKAPFSATQDCVEPLDVIRSKHGSFLMHIRDETVHNGIRGNKHSLNNCIDCHVTPNAQGETLSVHQDPQHFCSSCHEFAAVKVDCFQCHASTPAE